MRNLFNVLLILFSFCFFTKTSLAQGLKNSEPVGEFNSYLESLPDKQRWREGELKGGVTRDPKLDHMTLVEKTGLRIYLHRADGVIEFRDPKESVKFKFGRPLSEIKQDGCEEYMVNIQNVTAENVFFSRTCQQVTANIRVKFINTSFFAYNLKKRLLIRGFNQFDTFYNAISPTPDVQETPTGYTLKWSGVYNTYNPLVSNKSSKGGVWTWKGNDLNCIDLELKNGAWKRVPYVPDDSGNFQCTVNISKPISVTKLK